LLGSWGIVCRFGADLSREKLKIKKEERKKEVLRGLAF
jgi:hypothetical protein